MEKKAGEITRDAEAFVRKRAGKGSEKQDDRTFWEDLLEDVFSLVSARNGIETQKPVKFNGTTKFIDVYVKASRVVIEHKSYGIGLLKPEQQSDGVPLTPLQQGEWQADGQERSQAVNAVNYKTLNKFTKQCHYCLSSNF